MFTVYLIMHFHVSHSIQLGVFQNFFKREMRLYIFCNIFVHCCEKGFKFLSSIFKIFNPLGIGQYTDGIQFYLFYFYLSIEFNYNIFPGSFFSLEFLLGGDEQGVPACTGSVIFQDFLCAWVLTSVMYQLTLVAFQKVSSPVFFR